MNRFFSHNIRASKYPSIGVPSTPISFKHISTSTVELWVVCRMVRTAHCHTWTAAAQGDAPRAVCLLMDNKGTHAQPHEHMVHAHACMYTYYINMCMNMYATDKRLRRQSNHGWAMSR